jgi:hypothetical protein
MTDGLPDGKWRQTVSTPLRLRTLCGSGRGESGHKSTYSDQSSDGYLFELIVFPFALAVFADLEIMPISSTNSFSAAWNHE